MNYDDNWKYLICFTVTQFEKKTSFLNPNQDFKKNHLTKNKTL